MPILNIENLDDVLAYDGIGSFVGGQVSGTRSNLLEENESAQLVNCDVTRTGECRTRRGTVRLAGTIVPGPGGQTFTQGLGFYESSSESYLVAAGDDGAFYKWTGTAWNVLGAFSYTFTSATTNRVLLVMGAPTAKLYALVVGETAIHYWNGAAWTALGTTSPTGPGPNASWMVWHTNRLVVVGGPTKPETLYFSQFLDGTVWDWALWSMDVSGDGVPVTGLCSWTDFNLIVMKRNSLWVINCDPQLQLNDTANSIAGFQKKPIHQSIGCLAPATACMVGSDVFMLTTSGVRSIKRTLAAESQTDIGDPLSYRIQDIIDRINPNAVATAVATFWNNRYILALPLDGASHPNYVAVYNVLTESWHGLWTGWTPTCFSYRTVAGVPRLVFGQSDGRIFEWLDWVSEASEVDATFQDDGIAIPVTVLTKSFDFKEPVCRKEPFNCQFEFNRSQADVIVQVIRDGADPESFQQFSTATPSATLPVTLPFLLPTQGVRRRGFGMMRFQPCRELQFKLTTVGGKLVLRSIVAGGFVNTLDVEIQ